MLIILGLLFITASLGSETPEPVIVPTVVPPSRREDKSNSICSPDRARIWGVDWETHDLCTCSSLPEFFRAFPLADSAQCRLTDSCDVWCPGVFSIPHTHNDHDLSHHDDDAFHSTPVPVLSDLLIIALNSSSMLINVTSIVNGYVNRASVLVSVATENDLVPPPVPSIASQGGWKRADRVGSVTDAHPAPFPMPPKSVLTAPRSPKSSASAASELAGNSDMVADATSLAAAVSAADGGDLARPPPAAPTTSPATRSRITKGSAPPPPRSPASAVQSAVAKSVRGGGASPSPGVVTARTVISHAPALSRKSIHDLHRGTDVSVHIKCPPCRACNVTMTEASIIVAAQLCPSSIRAAGVELIAIPDSSIPFNITRSIVVLPPTKGYLPRPAILTVQQITLIFAVAGGVATLVLVVWSYVHRARAGWMVPDPAITAHVLADAAHPHGGTLGRSRRPSLGLAGPKGLNAGGPAHALAGEAGAHVDVGHTSAHCPPRPDAQFMLIAPVDDGDAVGGEWPLSSATAHPVTADRVTVCALPPPPRRQWDDVVQSMVALLPFSLSSGPSGAGRDRDGLLTAWTRLSHRPRPVNVTRTASPIGASLASDDVTVPSGTVAILAHERRVAAEVTAACVQAAATGGSGPTCPPTERGMKRLLRSRIPGIERLRRYNVRRDLAGDVTAGLSVGLMLVPQALAYAAIAGVPTSNGLYSSFIGLIIYAFLGSSNVVTVGPTAVMALLVANSAARDGSEPMSPRWIATIIGFGAISGVIQLVFGLLDLGFLVHLIPRPVILAFITSAALTIGAEQMSTFLGIKMVPRGFVAAVFGPDGCLPRLLETTSTEFIIAITCCFTLLALQSLRRSPALRQSSIVFSISIGRNAMVIAFASLVVYYFDLKVATSPRMSATLQLPQMPTLRWDMLQQSIVIAMIGFLEDFSMAKAFQRVPNAESKVVASQELIALGLANIIGSFFGAFPVTGSLTRSAVNATSGVRSAFSGLFTASLVIFSIYVLAPLFRWIPNAALAAMIIVAIWQMLDFHEMRLLYRSSPIDFAIFLISTFTGLFVSLTMGIAVGCTLAVSIIVLRSLKPPVAATRLPHDIAVVTVPASLTFLGADAVIGAAENLQCDTHTPLRGVAFQCASVADVDDSAAYAICEFAADLAARKPPCRIVFAAAPEPVLRSLRSAASAIGRPVVIASAPSTEAAVAFLLDISTSASNHVSTNNSDVGLTSAVSAIGTSAGKVGKSLPGGMGAGASDVSSAL